METAKRPVIQRLREEKVLNDSLRAELLAALKEFKERFMTEKKAVA
jgi:hypothetical protein